MLNMTLTPIGNFDAYAFCSRRGVDWRGPAISFHIHDKTRKVEYRGHLPGGNVIVEIDGATYCAAAVTFKELR